MMNETLQQKLNAFDDTLEFAYAKTIPADWYTDPEIYRKECDNVFQNNWLLVGHLHQLEEPSSYFTIEIAGKPILVVRKNSGELRAFANVCPHRGAQLTSNSCGKASRLKCPYHGWSFDLDGNLTGVPYFDDVKDFSREEHGLFSLTVETWANFIFIHMGQDRIPLTEYLSPMPERITEQVQEMHFVEVHEYSVECNWKVFVDNALEGYHMPIVHGNGGIGNLVKDFNIEYHKYLNIQHCLLTKKMGINDERVSKSRTSEAQLYWLFPNVLINIFSNFMVTLCILPYGLDRTKVVISQYSKEHPSQLPPEAIADSVYVSERTLKEDGAICQKVQLGLSSGFFNTARLSVKYEGNIYHFHKLLAQALRKN